MKRQTLVAIMAILATDESIADEQADLVSDVLTGRIKRRDLRTEERSPDTTPVPEPSKYMNIKEAAAYPPRLLEDSQLLRFRPHTRC